MEKVRRSRVRVVQATEDGKRESFVIGLDDMFLFEPRLGLHLRLARDREGDKEMMSTASSIPRTAAC
jgi:hypothetical protein